MRAQRDVVEVLSHLGGAARARQLRLLGCSPDAVRHAVDVGRVERLARGRFALPAAPDPRRSAVAVGGLVSHLSAAQAWGLELARTPQRVHVTVPRTRSRVAAHGTVLHWSDVDPADVGDHITEPRRTVLDCARTLPFPEGLAVADSALRHGLVDPADLRHEASLLRGTGSVRARTVASLADARAANPFETMLRALAWQAGLRVVPQAEITGPGLFARVDLADLARRLVLEADSFEFHGRRAALARDCRRYDELVVAEFRVLRFAWEQVHFEQEWVLDLLRRAADLPPLEHARSRRLRAA